MEINTDFAGLADEALATYAAEVRTASVDAIATLSDASTDDEIAAVETLADHADAVAAEVATRETAAAGRADRAAALRTRFSAEEETEEDAEAEEVEVEAAEEDAEEAEEEVEVKAKVKGVQELAKKVARPVPGKQTSKITITAAADVPDFSTGQNLEMAEVGQALVARMRGFSVPSGDGQTENLQQYGVAKFKMDFDEELTIKPHGDDMAVLSHAAKEARLPGKSLTAAGGWCAPSETLYDLCVTGESLDGLVSIPEVNVSRGGIKYTSGPDFSTIYSSVGFLQTEAQAIAGTTKTCFEVPCPSFTDVRLDAIGLCIKAPILTNSAYPELVNRWLTGSMVAHAHKVNATTLTRMATAAGAALTVSDFNGSAANTLANLEYIADGLRQSYKMSLDETLEIVVPFWVKGAIRSDLSLRTGRNVEAVTDAMIAAEFAVRNLAVQYVYDWQEFDVTQEGYPATFTALVYPAGTFVKGTSDVITLNAVYDAASLATNIYTALFFEQGLLVAKMCATAKLVTIPVCNSGRTGIANVASCGLLVP